MSQLESQLDNIFIYVNNHKQIVISGQLKTNTKMELYDIQGRLIVNENLNHQALTNKINVSSINKGIYLICISNSLGLITQKLIIK
ncbi:MAG: T9SS type A sorting domain-containing protein [Psychroserpens sp.]|nr:T9SS type A sorting domain-containing protein [Psychroserpens sp.]